jgi:DNA-binding XRE family transcriptional regulator
MAKFMRLVWSEGKLLNTPAPRLSGRVKGKKVIGRKMFTAPFHPINDSGPGRRRDSLVLFPLNNCPGRPANISGHIREGFPGLKDIGDGVHPQVIHRDELSRKGRTKNSVPETPTAGTMVPMGRGITPARFKKDFVTRLAVARNMRGYTRAEVATYLGIPEDTYKRYEQRTPIPHQYIPAICELLEIEPTFLYLGPERTRKVDSA